MRKNPRRWISRSKPSGWRISSLIISGVPSFCYKYNLTCTPVENVQAFDQDGFAGTAVLSQSSIGGVTKS